ncbi:PREDICTED: probable E3 ubiquitin-protein ligase LUL4 [Tarenaya hassleriana]|uniref:probable E3 ubiquitin-protein ligase LUL4 n=1 Tax=Tarenaya hassleriana TaxID=28532 RepID=UPI0008FD7E74|nr:PREDICTED: probable E3 ubiquitin-protein ligase LUL4 [Tarenaya hassleriana]
MKMKTPKTQFTTKHIAEKLPRLCLFLLRQCYGGCGDRTRLLPGSASTTRFSNLGDRPIELQIRVGSILRRVHTLKPGRSKRLKHGHIYRAYMPGGGGDNLGELLYGYDETCRPYIWVHDTGMDFSRMVKQQYISLEDLRDCSEIRVFRDREKGCVSVQKRSRDGFFPDLFFFSSVFCFLAFVPIISMGISFSNRRRNNHRRHHHHLHPPPPPPPYYYLPDPPRQPLPPPVPPQQQQEYTFTANPTYLPALPPPPPPPPPMIQSCSHGPYNSYGYGNAATGRYNYHYHYYPQQAPYFAGQTNGWAPMLRPPAMVGPPPQPPPYVEHQSAKKVRNDVNVHKDTVRLEVDDLSPGHLLVSFVFDALFDGSFTITFFAKEEAKCELIPQFPEVYAPTRVPFYKGLSQKFLQPSGTGTDLGFFALDDLSKPSSDDVYPLVISADTSVSPNSSDSEESVHKQITQAVLEKADDGSFKAKVVKQILWIEGVRYELRELYGIGSSNTEGPQSLEDSDSGKECVICMAEPKDTAVLPCRHLCMCSDCAKELRIQSNKCPICRQPIEELLEIKVDSNEL